jgi:hypothetical protein
LTVVYKWVGDGEAYWFEIYISPANSDGCVEGPLLYSQYLEGEAWQANYNTGTWHASGRVEDLQAEVAAPALPDQFRICVATYGGGRRVWEEFLFQWLP